MIGVLPWLGGVSILVAGLVGIAHRRDIIRARERVHGKAIVLPSPYGDIEYTETGSGREILILYGAGGGYDLGTPSENPARLAIPHLNAFPIWLPAIPVPLNWLVSSPHPQRFRWF